MIRLKLDKSSRRRAGISSWAVFFVIVVLLVAAAAYYLYTLSIAPTISISSGNSSCSSITFLVTNNNGVILHGWVATLKVNPPNQNIDVTPSSAVVAPLAPHGTYSNSFDVSFAGAPTGQYQVQANLINGTSTLATSNTITCTIG